MLACVWFITGIVTDGLGGPSKSRLTDARTAGGHWDGGNDSGTGKAPVAVARMGIRRMGIIGMNGWWRMCQGFIMMITSLHLMFPA